MPRPPARRLGGSQRVSEQQHICGCGETFVAAGTIHGQPASLWTLLEHQANDHTKGPTVALTFRDIRLNEKITLTGVVTTMDASNGREIDDPRWALLPSGEARITLHIRLADQPNRPVSIGAPMTHDDLYRELIGAADSLDTHVDAATAAAALRTIADRLDTDGLTTPDGDAA